MPRTQLTAVQLGTEPGRHESHVWRSILSSLTVSFRVTRTSKKSVWKDKIAAAILQSGVRHIKLQLLEWGLFLWRAPISLCFGFLVKYLSTSSCWPSPHFTRGKSVHIHVLRVRHKLKKKKMYSVSPMSTMFTVICPLPAHSSSIFSVECATSDLF